MPEAKVVLVNPLGLHARAAAKIVKIANESDSVVEIERPSKASRSDARSILGLLGLGAKVGSSLIIRAEGKDAESVLENIVELIEKGFGEI